MLRLRRNQALDLHKHKTEMSHSEILIKDAGPFLKIPFFFRSFSHNYAVANQVPCFSSKCEDAFNANIF